MKVSIIDSASRFEIISYEINLGELHHEPTNDEYYAKAWQRAVEDGIVEEDDPDDYSFSF